MADFERLSALDASFLRLERPNLPMHLAATLLFDRAPMLDEDGLLDLGSIRRTVRARLDDAPRLRMRIESSPLTGHPVWIDDAHFDLGYHLRSVMLPPPGTRESLRDLVGLVLSQPLDRARPLWEIWVVDGVEGGRVAAICKMHHCLMDGLAGVGAMAVLLRPTPSAEVPSAPEWVPRPPPSASTLLTAEAMRRVGGGAMLLAMARQAAQDPLVGLARLREGAESLFELGVEALTPASSTPLNGAVGPQRSVRWLRVELADLKKVKNALGGTVNDVVVTAVAGGLRRFFASRDLDPDAMQCRAMFPVNIRSESDDGANRIAAIAGRLPVNVADPRARHTAVRASTSASKASRVARGSEIVNAVSDWTLSSLAPTAQDLAARLGSYNVVITNIPGPQVPLFMCEAPMLEVYPTLPLFERQALSIAVFSYAGWLYWGLTADPERVPDLGDLAKLLQDEVADLLKVAGHS